jgi:hypothetical protein
MGWFAVSAPTARQSPDPLQLTAWSAPAPAAAGSNVSALHVPSVSVACMGWSVYSNGPPTYASLPPYPTAVQYPGAVQLTPETNAFPPVGAVKEVNVLHTPELSARA